MPTITLSIDRKTEERLMEISAEAGDPVSRTASRLLQRAVRATRPRPAFDAEAIRADQSDFAKEDLALAESSAPERGQLLVWEDAA